MAPIRRVRLEIYGRVQGVFYRASTREKAQELGLCGWVRNRRDGSVEAVAEGPDEMVDELVQWAHTGPTQARVDRVEIAEQEALTARELTGFEIRR